MISTLGIPQHALLRERLLRNSRKKFNSFMSMTTPGYEWGWFNEYLCYRLQKFYKDYEAGKNPRLMIFAPPRSGKSELASRRFPAWLLGINPKLNVITTSYGLALGVRMSRDCKRIVGDQIYSDIFPNTRIPGKGPNAVKPQESVLESAEHWEVMDQYGYKPGFNMGSYKTAGTGGGISGMGFDIGIIDDPVKDYKDASSPTKQETNLEWYDTTFYTRRNIKKNGIIIIQTRWHKKDLSGQILERMKEGSGDNFDVLSFPMEATDDEYIYVEGRKFKSRSKGDILFPERMDQEFVESCKTNPLTWTALYQQNPTIAGGNFFKSHHWAYYTPASFANIKWKRKIITVDTAQKKGEHNDYSVFQVWGYDGVRIYLLHQVRAKMHSYELRDAAKLVWQEYGGGIVGPNVNADAFFIEDKVSGTGLIQELRNEGIPCVEIPRNTDKMTRAIDCHSYFHSGLVVLPSGFDIPWMTEYLMEFEEFSLDDSHEHDDQIDPTLDAVNILLKGEGGVNYSGY
jgi:predicted phage terminase large subunit-like protein